MAAKSVGTAKWSYSPVPTEPKTPRLQSGQCDTLALVSQFASWTVTARGRGLVLGLFTVTT